MYNILSRQNIKISIFHSIYLSLELPMIIKMQGEEEKTEKTEK